MTDKLMAEHLHCDDGQPWGWVLNGTWRAVPKVPLLLALLGPPPFDVTLPDGQVRHIMHQPRWLRPAKK